MNTRKNYVVIAIALLSLVALVGSAQAAANLTVTKNHPGYVFSDLTNVMTAQVKNSGDAANAADFNVSIEITSAAGTLYTHKTTGVGPLGAGASVEVNLGNWKPTNVENITINVTADCDGNVVESNETDNSRIETRNTTGSCSDDVKPKYEKIFEKECFGYRGQHPLTEAYVDVGGSDVIYTVGDYKYQNTTVNFEIGAPGGDVNRVDGNIADIPADATIEQATLYLYHAWRKGKTPKYPAWDIEFTNSAGTYTVAETANYTDCKEFGTSYMRERLYGTIVYNVTNYVTGDGTYTANVTGDIYPTGASYTSYGYASGMALMVVYDDGSGCKRYRIAHGHDRLATSYKVDTTKGYSYHVLPEDATTSATLTDANPSGDVTSAKLFTATVDAVDFDTGAPGKELLKCNYCGWNEGAWSNDGMDRGEDYPIGFSRDEVTDCLSGAGRDETVQFQERDGSYKNGYSAVFAVLIVEKATTYDFSTGAGVDKWAYRFQVEPKTPITNGVPDIGFTDDEYTLISENDHKLQKDSTDTYDYYAAHRFIFNISESVDSIVEIDVQWTGKGVTRDRRQEHGATLYIWNTTPGYYRELGNTTKRQRETLTGVITANPENYIDTDGILTILVVQNAYQSTPRGRALVSMLSTDYVRADIT